MRRIALLVVTALLASPAAARAAGPTPDAEPIACPRTNQAPPGTEFEVRGPGAQAFIGGWQVTGGEASLCFRGAGGAGGRTSIVAGWRTPWMTSESPEWNDSYEFTSANPIDDVNLHFTLRSRFKGEEWGRWSGHEQRSSPPVGAGGGFSAAGFIFASVGRPVQPPPIQWEWRVEIQVSGPGALDMNASMHDA